LADLLIDNGIGADSRVVVVGKIDTPSEKACQPRVALTLYYAGIPNVAILDGGHNKWAAEKRALSTEAAKPSESSYEAKFNVAVLADKSEVMDKLGNAIIGDVRGPAYYNGQKKRDFVAKAGRIKGAVNLPTGQVYTASGTFKPKEDLLKMAESAVGNDRMKEIILYCDTGKACSTWWFLLKELLGYKNVRTYDGSMQEWTMDPNAPIEP
jgi:thiosulfate/3-mercaptopyruvate sulfurtransferase